MMYVPPIGVERLWITTGRQHKEPLHGEKQQQAGYDRRKSADTENERCRCRSVDERQRPLPSSQEVWPEERLVNRNPTCLENSAHLSEL